MILKSSGSHLSKLLNNTTNYGSAAIFNNNVFPLSKQNGRNSTFSGSFMNIMFENTSLNNISTIRKSVKREKEFAAKYTYAVKKSELLQRKTQMLDAFEKIHGVKTNSRVIMLLNEE